VEKKLNRFWRSDCNDFGGSCIAGQSLPVGKNPDYAQERVAII
jgi:hypothetical protein